MRKSLLSTSTLILGLAALSGCASMFDSDGDGLTNQEEAELGTNPDEVDSDGDGLRDLKETTMGTDPLVADTDGDGLTDGDEVKEYDTDPLVADMDRDGFLDGEEIAAGSDPTVEFSWPFGTGEWPDFSWKAEGVSGTGWDSGDVIENFTLTDSYGNSLDLYQFYGYSVLIDFSAGWCGPCQGVAEGAQEMWVEERDNGFLIVHIMSGDWTSSNVDVAFLSEWEAAYELEFPVTMEESTNVYGDLAANFNEGGYIPFMVLIGPDFVIDSGYVGGGQEETALARAKVLMGQ